MTRVISRHFTGGGWGGQYYLIILLQAAFILPLLNRVKLPGMVPPAAFILLMAWAALVAGHAEWPTSTAGKFLDDRAVLFWLPYLLLCSWLSARWNGRLRTAVPPLVGLAGVAGLTLALQITRDGIGPSFTSPATPYLIDLLYRFHLTLHLPGAADRLMRLAAPVLAAVLVLSLALLLCGGLNQLGLRRLVR